MDSELFTKIVLCGSSTVGKTTLFNRIVNSHLDEKTTSTTGASFASVKYEFDGQTLHLNFWDTAGQEEYRSLVNIYFRSSDIVIILFDLTKPDTFEEVDVWMDEVLANCGEHTPTVIVAGNKNDLEEERRVNPEQIGRFLETVNCQYFEISAFADINVDLLMKAVAISAKKSMIEKEKRNENERIVKITEKGNENQISTEVTQKGECC